MRRILCVLLFAWLAVALASVPKLPKFITLEGGQFIMGHDCEDQWCMDGPAHDVTVGPFKISAYEVTQKEWEEIMSFNPSAHVGEYLPVEQVTWTQTLEYCNRRSIKEGLKPCYSFSFMEGRVICDWRADGYRLPTEAEWEFAAKGGSRGQGFLFSGSDYIDEVAWYQGNSLDETHIVGTKSPNEVGIYDMTGNVWEFCWDGWWYNYTQNSEYSPRDESQHLEGNFRGGSYTNPAGESHTAFRGFGTSRKRNIGFRIVRTVL